MIDDKPTARLLDNHNNNNNPRQPHSQARLPSQLKQKIKENRWVWVDQRDNKTFDRGRPFYSFFGGVYMSLRGGQRVTVTLLRFTLLSLFILLKIK